MAPLGNLIRAALAGIAPYNAGLGLRDIRARYGIETIAKLSSNENPHGPAPAVLQALRLTPPDLYLYPDGTANRLRDALCGHLHVAADRLIFGNGSEELVSIICRTVIEPGDRVVTLYPSFPLHEDYVVMMGGTIERIAVTETLQIDIDALIAAAALPARMLIFANPMNPVGCGLGPQDLRRVIAAKHPDTLLVLDEAYHEYAALDLCGTGHNLLDETHGNWIILRTFSKAWGLAGLRIGFGLCSSPELRAAFDLVRTPFNVNAAAQIAACAALRATDHMSATIAATRSERNRVGAAMRALGYKVAPSMGNFLFFDTGEPSQILAERLMALGTIVKPWKQPHFDTFLRVSIGIAAENDKFIADMRAVTHVF